MSAVRANKSAGRCAPVGYRTPVVVTLSPELSTMTHAARQAGAILMRHFDRASRAALRISLKGPADFVSNADLESEHCLRDVLLGAYPDHGFLGEERAPTLAEGARFIVDPLDGTTNYLRGIPHFAVSIALERAGSLVAGVVFDPAKDEMFTAQVGLGAWLGAEPLRVTTEADLANAVIGTGIPHGNKPERHERYLVTLAHVMRESAGIRRFSAAALDLAYVASGRLDAFFELGLSAWDIAAGALLVREAGGRATDPSGSEDVLASGDILATNGVLHARLLDVLSRRAVPRGQGVADGA
jgi:myo-inositol-1(or 4)-monophosphatase